jgi:Flp pilus assembly pilin Flp
MADAAGGPPAHSHAVRSALTNYLSDRRGVTAIEYGLMVGLMTLAIVAAINTLGVQALTQLFTKVANSM